MGIQVHDRPAPPGHPRGALLRWRHAKEHARADNQRLLENLR